MINCIRYFMNIHKGFINLLIPQMWIKRGKYVFFWAIKCIFFCKFVKCQISQLNFQKPKFSDRYTHQKPLNVKFCGTPFRFFTLIVAANAGTIEEVNLEWLYKENYDPVSQTTYCNWNCHLKLKWQFCFIYFMITEIPTLSTIGTKIHKQIMKKKYLNVSLYLFGSVLKKRNHRSAKTKEKVKIYNYYKIFF